MKKVAELENKYKFRVVVGGPGAWQFRFSNDTSELEIDVVISGEGEK